MRARAEPFGAWVRADDATLVAVSRRGARRLGLDGGALWAGDAPSPATAGVRAPLEVHVAVTSRCGAGCTGCYLDARADGQAPPFDELCARLDAIARAGAFTVAFGGGEPVGRADLGDLAAHARALGLAPVVTTSGLGLTREKAARLGAFAQVNVSYDGAGSVYEDVRGFDGSAMAERAMGHLAEAGVPFGANVVLTRTSFEHLGDTLARAEALGAREGQLLRYKPAGRAASLEYLARRLSPEQVGRLPAALEAAWRARTLALRIDCALVPLLSSDGALDADRLARFGVFGCEAGRHLASLDIGGRVAPCSFAPPSAIDAAGVAAEFSRDAHLAAWRAVPAQAPCGDCPLASVCRGGCKIVASHLDARIGPDPECPRVRAHRELARAPA